MIKQINRAPAAVAACLAAVTLIVGCGASPDRTLHLSSGCPGARRVALTFDDGPNPPYTNQILDELKAAGVNATFFTEGASVEAHPEAVREEAASGMAIGAHSYRHSADLPGLSHAAFAADLRLVESALVAVTGVKPALYRSPFGHTSDMMLEEERKRGYTSIGWDVDSEDWSDASVERVVSNVLDHAHPGAIILMHDGGLGGGNPDRSTTLAALPRVIDGLRARDYALVTVPEIIGLPDPHHESEAACSAS